MGNFHMGDCQNYGPFWGPYYNTGPNLGDPKRDQNFDNPPYVSLSNPRAPSYLNSSLLGYVTVGYIVPSSHYLGNWSPRVT